MVVVDQKIMFKSFIMEFLKKLTYEKKETAPNVYVGNW